MTNHVFIVSEWLPKPGCDAVLMAQFKKLVAQTQQEAGCISAHVTRQIAHLNSPTQSPFTIVALQEYENIAAFEAHCAQAYVKQFFAAVVNNEATALVAQWQCRLFGEQE